MGINNLWQLVSSSARRVSLETLEGTRLAIDVSIWLTQFVKAMRDDEGRPIPNAHIIGALRRIVKLLYYGIRPIFVFDGGVPAVKAKLISARQMRRERDGDHIKQTARRLLVAQLKAAALRKREDRRKRLEKNVEAREGSAYVAGFDPGAQSSAQRAEASAHDGPAETGAAGGGFDTGRPFQAQGGSNPQHDDDDDGVAWEAEHVSDTEEHERDWGINLDGDASRFDVAVLAELPLRMRKEAIEAVQRAQRIAARREFMPVAGDPEAFSSTQLAVFLKGAAFRQKVAQVQKMDEDAVAGERIHSDAARRFMLMQDRDKDSQDRERGGAAARMARFVRANKGEFEEDDEPMDNGGPTRLGPPRRDGAAAAEPARRKRPEPGLGDGRGLRLQHHSSAIARPAFIQNRNARAHADAMRHARRDSHGYVSTAGMDEAAEEAEMARIEAHPELYATAPPAAYDDSDGDQRGGADAQVFEIDDDDGGGFLREAAAAPLDDGRRRVDSAQRLDDDRGGARPRQRPDETEDARTGQAFEPASMDDDDDCGGGFFRDDAEPPSTKGADAPDDDGGGGFLPDDKGGAPDDDDDDDGGGGFFSEDEKDTPRSRDAGAPACKEEAGFATMSGEGAGGASKTVEDGTEVVIIEDDDFDDWEAADDHAEEPPAESEGVELTFTGAVDHDELDLIFGGGASPWRDHDDDGGGGFDDDDNDFAGGRAVDDAGGNDGRERRLEDGGASEKERESAERNAAAIANAYATASKLTGWAGSAFRKAMRETGVPAEDARASPEDARASPPAENARASSPPAAAAQPPAARRLEEAPAPARHKPDEPPRHTATPPRDEARARHVVPEDAPPRQVVVVEDDDDDILQRDDLADDDVPQRDDSADASDGPDDGADDDADDGADIGADDGPEDGADDGADDDAFEEHRAAAREQGFYDACPDFDAQLRFALDNTSTADLGALHAAAGDCADAGEAAVWGYVAAAVDARQQSDFNAHRRVAAREGFYDVCPDFDAQLQFALESMRCGADLEGLETAAAAATDDREAQVLRYLIDVVRKALPQEDASDAGGPDGDFDGMRDDGADVYEDGDGEPRDAAVDEAAARRLDDEAAELRREMNRKDRDAAHVTDEMRNDVMALLDCLGVPYVVAPMEAEAQCAALELAGLCDGVVTDDSDAFVFGAKKVYKNIFDEKKFVEAYYAADVQRELKIARPEFVALALLLGGDYCPGVKGVGIVNGMEIVSAFRDDDGSCLPLLERFRAWHDGTEVAIDEEDQAHVIGRKEFTEKHRRARLRWELPPNFPSTEAVEAYTNPAVGDAAALVRRQRGDADLSDLSFRVDAAPEASEFKWGEPDVAALHAFCSSRHLAWTDGELDAALRPMLEKRAAAAGQPQQRRLDQYYEAYHSNVRVAHVKSKRLKRALADAAAAAPTNVSKPPRPSKTLRRNKAAAASSSDGSEDDGALPRACDAHDAPGRRANPKRKASRGPVVFEESDDESAA